MAAQREPEIAVRPMTLADLDGVLAVERLSFRSPWSALAFRSELTQNACAHYVVAGLGERIVGYGGMWVILDEAHVTNVAVHPDLRGQGLGERLMHELITRAMVLGAKRMTLEVRVSNAVAQNLYRKVGFQARGVRKEYYPDNREDAIIMWKDRLP